jgi:hypothetical protein
MTKPYRLGRLRGRSDGYTWRSGWALILCASEAEDEKENKRQQKQTDSKTRAFSKALCHVDAQDDPDDKIHKRNEHQKDPPTGAAGDFAQKVCV